MPFGLRHGDLKNLESLAPQHNGHDLRMKTGICSRNDLGHADRNHRHRTLRKIAAPKGSPVPYCDFPKNQREENRDSHLIVHP
jgi:hypothetical protein